MLFDKNDKCRGSTVQDPMVHLSGRDTKVQRRLKDKYKTIVSSSRVPPYKSR